MQEVNAVQVDVWEEGKCREHWEPVESVGFCIVADWGAEGEDEGVEWKVEEEKWDGEVQEDFSGQLL